MPRSIAHHIIAFLILLSCTTANAQWCCIDTNLIVQDLNTTTLRLQIAGATNNNLANPGQGLCGVRIKFEHQFLGDMKMSLVSPGGQVLELVGSTGNFGFTSFTQWNITFFPCDSVARPDPGFKPRWENNQNWGIFGEYYDGSYYPNKGCLSDLNMGPVNGSWALVIEDVEKFYTGRVTELCLLFCDDAGINCASCAPNGGIFDTTYIAHCEKDDSLLIKPNIDFPLFLPDPILYGYGYYVSKNDTIIAKLKDIDLRNFQPGIYTVCGFSYLMSDSVKLPNLALPNILSNFRARVNSILSPICAEFSKNCLDVEIFDIPDTNLISTSICIGDSFQLGNLFIKNPGTYIANLNTVYNCDSVVQLQLSHTDIQIRLNTPDTITCINDSITLHAENSIISPSAIVRWYSNDGTIADQSMPLNPIILSKGVYYIEIIDGACVRIDSIEVIQSNDVPLITVLSDTITCSDTLATLLISSDNASDVFEWFDGPISLGSLSQIDLPFGIYRVVATRTNGCKSILDITTPIDTSTIAVSLSGDVLSCKQPLSTLSATWIGDATMIEWKDRFNIKQDSNAIIHVAVPGTFYFTITANNGCKRTDSLLIESQIYAPAFLRVVGDTINCDTATSKFIFANATGEIPEYFWVLPDSSLDTGSVIEIIQVGEYKLSVIDSNACRADTSIRIFADTHSIPFTLKVDSIACSPDSVQIQLSTNEIPLAFGWRNNAAFTSNEQSPYVKEEGWYYVNVINHNGCFSSDSIEVFKKKEVPQILVSSVALSCKADSVQIITVAPTAVHYEWTGPNMFFSTTLSPYVKEPGVYKIIVNDTFNCFAEKQIIVHDSTRAPQLTILVDTLNCSIDTAQISIMSDIGLDSLYLSPIHISKNIQSYNTEVTQAGVYYLFALGTNGCVQLDTVEVIIDTLKPNIYALTDTINCFNPSVTLFGTSTTQNAQFEWRTPSGNLLRTNVISIDTAGSYKLMITSRNTCTNDTTIIVEIDTIKPLLQLIGDTIICRDRIAQLIGVSNMSLVNITWRGPNMFISNNDTILTQEPGWYTLRMQATNGCTQSDSFLLIDQTQKIDVLNLPKDTTFNCRSKSNLALQFNSNTPLDSVVWQLPNSNVIYNQNPLVVSDTGLYILQIIDTNGCVAFDSVFVHIDTLGPQVLIQSVDTLTCIKDSVTLMTSTSSALQYQWSGPNLFMSQLPNPSVGEAGVYTLQVTGSNTCTSIMQVQVYENRNLPQIFARDASLDCLLRAVQLDFTSPDSLRIVYWILPDSSVVQSNSVIATQIGIYRVIVEDQKGCKAQKLIEVTDQALYPIVSTMSDTLKCNPDSVQVFATAQIPIANYQWSGPGQFSSNLSSPFVKTAGRYQVIVNALNGCADTTTHIVHADTIKPQLQLFADTITCNIDSAQLSSVFDNNIQTYQWTGPNFSNNQNKNPFVRNGGLYQLQIIGKNGCITHDSILVVLDTVKPAISLFVKDALNCMDSMGQIANQNMSQRFQYSWSAIIGKIAGPINQSEIQIIGPGQYALSILDRINGCRNSDTIDIQQTTTLNIDLQSKIKHPSCFEINNGAIELIHRSGGTAPFEYALNASGFSTNNVFTNLSSGMFHLFVRDSNACLFDTFIQLDQKEQLFVDLGPDRRIKLGQTAQIVATIRPITSIIVDYNWLPSQFLDCNVCQTVISSPSNDIRYQILVTDSSGCTATDEILIRIDDETGIYVPNVFSPDKNGINDQVEIITAQPVTRVISYQIFDRWGELVYEVRNFPISDRTKYWDGNFKGKAVQNGIYVYLIEIELLNSEIKKLFGEITLIR